MSSETTNRVVILGAGPAGLTAAYQLTKAKIAATILEKSSVVGGLSRTVDYKGYLFDLGGHRFYTKVKAVENIWREVLSSREFLRRKRVSRIYFNRNFFPYPLRLSPTLLKVGIWNGVMIFASFLSAKAFPYSTEENLEQWVINRFGKRLYEIFFKTYTEKVWGMPCTEISAEWAAQRIRELSLTTAVKSAFSRHTPRTKDGVIKTLIDEFDYPQKGPGMMWERMRELIKAPNNEICLNANVRRIVWDEEKGVTAVSFEKNSQTQHINGSHFISTMPIRELIQILSPAPPHEVIEAAQSLQYRDFLTVALIINRAEIFPDNWLYIHDPKVKLGRIQNFKNWSSEMVADQSKTCLGLEYFCFENDGLWRMSDEELIELGKRELAYIGLVDRDEVTDGKVVRVQKAYPVYDENYQKALQVIRVFLDGLKNLYLVGRNGMHKYNNQDHSMLTAMLAVQNILGENHDLWAVNTEREYHEEFEPSELQMEIEQLALTQPLVPVKVIVKTISAGNSNN